MKISFNWIKELVPVTWSAEETADKLAELGFPVEGLQNLGVSVSKVISVKILNVDKHPNADRLRIAKVSDGKEERSIVCGAPNIAVGQIVPLATPGAKLPGGIEITVSKIRGIESAGMLCSERELGLSEEHAGILQLPPNTPLGKEVKDLMGGQDSILDVEITPNRPDLLSHIGIARELSAASRKTLKIPSVKPLRCVAEKSKFSITIDNKQKCDMYSGKVIRGIKVAPSPQWMVDRLKACGVRSINNIVDITNYVLLEVGHPLHAFDLAKLTGGQIRVRDAKAGESFLALDGKTYKLTADDLVIADENNAVALAGVMGGEGSGVTDSTTDILLESAHFDPVTVRHTSKRHTLRSESSLRFEKGTNIGSAQEASMRATQFILELAGGRLVQDNSVGTKTVSLKKVSLTLDRVKALLGDHVSPADVSQYLSQLGFEPKKSKQGWVCTVPAFRQDVFEDVDLIEEVARLLGYNNFASTMPVIAPNPTPPQFQVKDLAGLAQKLKAVGLSETITHSFCAQDRANDFGIPTDKHLLLANPLSKEETLMRPLISLNLLKAVALNQSHQQESVFLYEVGQVFEKTSQGHNEESHLAMVMAGRFSTGGWRGSAKDVDVFDLIGIFNLLGLELHFGSQKSYLHPYQSFDVSYRGKRIGWGGLLHPTLLSKWDLKGPVALAEVNLDALDLKRKKIKMAPLRRFPFVDRDIAVVVEKNKTWGDMLSHVKKSSGDLLVGAFPFDLFEGGAIGPTQKSLAFRVRLQHAERTLTENEINGVIESIKSSLQTHCGAQLR